MIHYSLPVRAGEERRGIFGTVLTQFISVRLVSVALLVETHKLSYAGCVRHQNSSVYCIRLRCAGRCFYSATGDFEMMLLCACACVCVCACNAWFAGVCDVELRATSTLIVFVCGRGADRQASLMDVCPKTTNWLSVNHQ